MFWRILGQLFNASRGRLAVALLALASGAAVTTALLNLNWDAERKMSAEFRTLGANVVILPSRSAADAANLTLINSEVPRDEYIRRSSELFHRSPTPPDDDPSSSPTFPEDIMDRLTEIPGVENRSLAPLVYIVASLGTVQDKSAVRQSVILAGTWLDRASLLNPWWKIAGAPIIDRNDVAHCLVGRSVATQLGLTFDSPLNLKYTDRNGTRSLDLKVSGVINSGGQEDSQVFANLEAVQKLAGLDGQIGLVQLNVPGTLPEVQNAVTQISAALPDVEVRPVPQIAQAEGRLLPRIRGLIFFMVALILVLTTLCVFASMAALAMERRRDVGLMKAIGGSMSRIVSIFLTEAGALGLAGALIGYVAGIFLSRWIGERAFHVAISARPEVLPLVIALMVAVALAGALPLRLLGNIRPAEIMRGE
jgi:putative ABC transport system permease protein